MSWRSITACALFVCAIGSDLLSDSHLVLSQGLARSCAKQHRYLPEGPIHHKTATLDGKKLYVRWIMPDLIWVFIFFDKDFDLVRLRDKAFQSRFR